MNWNFFFIFSNLHFGSKCLFEEIDTYRKRPRFVDAENVRELMRYALDECCQI